MSTILKDYKLCLLHWLLGVRVNPVQLLQVTALSTFSKIVFADQEHAYLSHSHSVCCMRDGPLSQYSATPMPAKASESWPKTTFARVARHKGSTTEAISVSIDPINADKM